MPFMHLHISNDGNVKACCVANIPLGNINENSENEIWNGKLISSLRNHFSKGIADKRCASCTKLEESGCESIRQETFRKFDFKSIELSPATPVYFDIRFSNVCNFKCRTCWHGASSKWFSDAQKLGTAIGEKAIIKNIHDFEKFIDNWGSALLNAQEFYFAGGEPLVTEEHYLLLNWLVENNATQARLRYNTNFSKLSFKKYDVLDLWNRFDNVEILASIDATHSLGEYIRKEMVWEDVISNRKKLKKLDHVKFKISPTISVFNVHDFPNLYQTCLDLELIQKNDFYINILQHPYYYNIQALPPQKKDKTCKHLLEFISNNDNKHLRKSVQEIIDYMMAKDRSNLWPKFLEQTQKIDELRGEKYFDQIFNDL